MQASIDSLNGSGGTAARSASLDAASALGRDDFLHLLVAKLENQDPLSPAEDTEFISELATFSSLEQLISVNENLQGLGLSQAQLLNSQALNLVGKYAIVDGSTVRVSGGEAETLYYELPAVAKEATLRIYDAEGNEVRSIELGTVPDGRVAVHWDGLDGAGNALEDGEYTVRIDAEDLGERPMVVDVLRAVRVDGASFLDGVITLVSGGRELPFTEILEIQEGRS